MPKKIEPVLVKTNTKEKKSRRQLHTERIISTGNLGNMVKLKYKDSKGRTSVRLIEPYKLDGDDFWGYDPVKDGIRRFKMPRIRSVTETKKHYEPRWQVELGEMTMSGIKTAEYYLNEIYKQASLNPNVKLKDTIVFDFDGVINSYSSGWQGIDSIKDKPVDGIKETIDKLRKKYRIIVVSTRCSEQKGIEAIKKYLDKHGIEVDGVMANKPAAIAYVDDNAIRFDGDCNALVKNIENSVSWVKKADSYFDEIVKTAQVMYHASPVQDIKRFRHSEDTSGNNKGKIVFVSPDPSFSSAFGTRWHDGNARLNVETSDTKVPTTDNYKQTTLSVTDKVDLDKPCSMYKLDGHFKPLRYEKDLEYYTNGDVKIVSEEKFKSFKDMAKQYGLNIKKVSDSYIQNKLKTHKITNFEKKASDQSMMIGQDGKIPAIEHALSDPIAKKVATMIATSHEYKIPNVDGALAMTKNYTWTKETMPVSKIEGINKPVNPEKVLDIAAGIKKHHNCVNPFIVVDKLHGIRPQTKGKKILLDGHHRKEACDILHIENVPVYVGRYTGNAEKEKSILREKQAFYLSEIFQMIK